MDCPWCGPSTGHNGICDSCGLTRGEHRYIEAILSDSEAVYRAEVARERKAG